MEFLVFAALAATAPSVRADLSEAAQAIRKAKPAPLTTLYKDYGLQDEEIDEKVAAAKDPLQLLRSFIPVYYSLAAEADPFTDLRRYHGHIVGDAHLENFGVLLEKDGRPAVTANDLDDATLDAPVHLDFVRLLTSVRLSKFKHDVSFQSIYAAYVEGLSGHSREVPPAFEDLLEHAKKAGLDPKGGLVNHKGHFDVPSDAKKLEDDERKGLQAALADAVVDAGYVSSAREVDWVDGFKLKKDYNGGAGGLERLIGAVSWKRAPADFVAFEAKELRVPGSYPVDGHVAAAAPRIEGILTWERGPSRSRLTQVAHFAGKDYLIRPKFEGETGIDMDKLDTKARQAALEYEGWLLGTLHAATLGDDRAAYLKAVKGHDPKDDWNAVADAYADRFESLFDEYRQAAKKNRR